MCISILVSIRTVSSFAVVRPVKGLTGGPPFMVEYSELRPQLAWHFRCFGLPHVPNCIVCHWWGSGLNILRALNRERNAARLEPVPVSCLRFRRRPVKVFEEREIYC